MVRDREQRRPVCAVNTAHFNFRVAPLFDVCWLKQEERYRYHFDMLNDRERNHAYAVSIAEVVCPADVVVDIGMGSGLLALLAAQNRSLGTKLWTSWRTLRRRMSC